MTDTHQEPQKLWNRSYILVLSLGVFTSMASQMVTPLISKYALSLGAPLTFAATIASMMSIAALVFRPFSGMVSDRVNRKLLMIIGTLVTAASVFLYSFAQGTASLMVMRMVHGVAFSFMGVANMAFGSSFIPKDRMGEGMGYLGLGSILSSAIGPNLGLFLSQSFGYPVCFTISAVISLAAVGMMCIIPYEAPKKTEKKKFTFHDLIAGEIIIYAMIMGLFSCGNGLLNTYLALIGDERHISNIALFFTAYSIALVVIRPLTGKILDRRGLTVILVPALFVASISMLIVGAAHTLWLFILAGALKAIGQGAGSPSIQANCIKTLGRERAGVASSTCYIGQDIGNAFAPIVGGVVATSYGYDTMFYGYAVLLLVCGLGLYRIQLGIEKRKVKKALSPSSAPAVSD